MGELFNYEARFPDSVKIALGNVDEAEEELDAIAAEESLIEFIDMQWSVLEPGRPIVRGWCIDAICEHL